jgi:hypothetical protein
MVQYAECLVNLDNKYFKQSLWVTPTTKSKTYFWTHIRKCFKILGKCFFINIKSDLLKTLSLLKYFFPIQIPLQTELDTEIKEYNDILQLSIEDGYQNLAYKTLTAFSWLWHR